MTQSTWTTSPVLYEDDHLLLIHKPSGTLSHPNPDSPKQHAAFEGTYDLHTRCFQIDTRKLWLIHRLDQDTSGVLIAAKDNRSAEILRQSFEAGKVRKFYAALVLGEVRPPKGRWHDHIALQKKGHSIRSRVVISRPPNAKLIYEVRKNFPRARLSLLRIELLSGKTHQIRVQAAYRRNPVAGDDIYGIFPINKDLRKKVGLDRIFLHAEAVQLPHPVTSKPLRVEAPLPEELAQVLRTLA